MKGETFLWETGKIFIDALFGDYRVDFQNSVAEYRGSTQPVPT